MKSKKSFFNKTIFKKNVTLYWPLWAVYTVILFCMQPGVLWVLNYNANFRTGYTMEDRVWDLISCLSMEGYILLIAFFAVLFGMALFSYLYNSKSANMIHSLPVDRTQLFGTNVLSGLAFLIVPQVFVSILSVIVCLAYGVMKIQYIGIWLFMAVGTSFVAFSIVTFCAMFTGLLVALPAYVVIVNLLSHWIYFLIYVVVTTFGYGVSSIGAGASKIAEMTSPFFCFMGYVGIYRDYDFMGNLKGIGVKGVNILCVYLVVAIVLYVVAYVIYQKRKIEHAGDLITVGWVKPIFRWGAGVSGGIFGGLLLRELFIAVGIGCPLPGAVILMLVLGGIAYFAADMLIYKSFHVFKKKNWIGCGVFSVALLVTFFGLYSVSGMYETYVPEIDEIKSADINMGYEVTFDGEDAAVILDIHEQILAQKEYCEEYREHGGYKYEYVSIRYNLKNGEYVNRGYEIPYQNDGTRVILKVIDEIESNPENFYRYIFCKDYDKVTEFGGGWLEAQFIKDASKTDEYNDYSYTNISLTQEEAAAFYQAILDDTAAGTLMKYNVYRNDGWDDSVIKHYYSEASLMIEYKDPNAKSSSGYINASENSYGYGEMVSAEYENWNNCYVSFGPDCENIVNKLIEFGYIEAVNDVWWGMNVEDGGDLYLD